ncbi:MAG: FG-GAP-like repeat-containing protein, partial [Phycisphaerae bacterium]
MSSRVSQISRRVLSHLGLAIAVLSIQPQVAQSGPLFDITEFDVGDSPHSVAIGDLDGDGNADLAVANYNSDNVSILLGNGDGTFSADVTFGAGDGPVSAAIGDLDGDGNADLAVANFESDSVSILLGNGDGTFAADVFFGAGDAPRWLAIGDLDSDGNDDLAVANQYSDNVSVLLGNGDGTFAADLTFGVGILPRSVAIADLDGDGNADLAIANDDSDNVSILLGNGDGTFAADATFGAGYAPFSVAIGDLNGDGDADLAVANSNSFDVSVLLGNGDGTFAAHATFWTEFGSASVVIGDLDLDGNGHGDLAVANYFSDNVSVLLGNGDGTFADDVTFGAGVAPTSVAIGDLDGDGDADLAVANAGSDNVSVLLNRTIIDCNTNGVQDPSDIAAGTSLDCNTNVVPDECEPDCNTNDVADACDLGVGTSVDCNTNGIPDACDVAAGTSSDCNTNGSPHECEAQLPDCNTNGSPDECDIFSGTSVDCLPNGIPDECEPDCNTNGTPDTCDTTIGGIVDCNTNGTPDVCDVGRLILVADDPLDNSNFGNAVDLDGDLIIVGNAQDSHLLEAQGSAYVFRVAGDAWVQDAKLLGSDTDGGDQFGYDVAIHSDTALVGSWRASPGGVTTGAAYVFEYLGGSWQQTQKLLPQNLNLGDNFGTAVDLLGDLAVITARDDDDLGESSGSAYVYRRVAGTWSLEQKLTASDGAAIDKFGRSVALDGDAILVGAWRSGADDRGAAYVFRWNAASWIEEQKLTPGDAGADDRFGAAVAIDGDIALIGAVREDDGAADSGAAYVFRFNGSIWIEEQKLKAPAPVDSDRFGVSVAIVGDAAIVGADRADDQGVDSGAVYVFRNANGVWTHVNTLFASNAAAGDNFGGDVALREDRGAIVASAMFNDAAGTDAGAAYAFPTTNDCNVNATPDECESDCNTNGSADDCEIAVGSAVDCDTNGVLDSCDLASDTTRDCN